MVVKGETSAAAPEPVTREGAGGYRRVTFRALGTECRIDFRAGNARVARGFLDEALAWIAGFEERYSRYRPGSMISAINRAAGEGATATDAELDGILGCCDRFHLLTGGIFDASALPLELLWEGAMADGRVPDAGAIRRARGLVGWGEVRRGAGWIELPRRGMGIDLGGIGKEYAVDRIFAMGRAWGIADLLVDLGRDLRLGGEPPGGGCWRVGLEHPRDPGRCWGGLRIAERSVATSGDGLRFVECDGVRYGHILDPRTGSPVANGSESASVIASTCVEAGILAKSAFILGGSEGVEFLDRAWGVEGCVWQGARRHETRGFGRYVL